MYVRGYLQGSENGRVVTIGVLAAILKMADILKIWKTQNFSSNGDLSLGQLLCLYHYPVRSFS